MPKQSEIVLPTQLVVEGKDQVNFFEAMVKFLKIDNLQIQNFGGVNELREFLNVFVKMPNFRIVERIGIVRDAEKCAESALQSVQSSLRNSELTAPSKAEIIEGQNPAVGILILPPNKKSGMLESLLNDSISGDPVESCIDEFFACAGRHGISISRPEKAKAHAYIATKNYPNLRVGEAAQKNYWKLQRDEFSGVRDFVQSLIAS